MDGTTQPFDLRINAQTRMSSSPIPTYNAVYDAILGLEGVPIKGSIDSISSSGGLTTLQCSVARQKVSVEVGDEFTGALSKTLDVSPSLRSFTVTTPAAGGFLWAPGSKVQFRVGQSGDVIQIEDEGHQGYGMVTTNGKLTLTHKGNSVSNAVGLSETNRFDADGDHKFCDYIVLRNGRWCAFSYAKGPGGSSSSWVMKELRTN